MQATFGNWTISIERKTYLSDDLAQQYDALATDWDDKLKRLGVDKAYTGLFKRLKNQDYLKHLLDNAHIFDAGIGTGALSFAFANVHTAPFTLHGCDISAKMLDTAHCNLQRMSTTPHLTIEDATHIQQADNTFDLTMTAHMLEHLENPLAGLREMVRITRKSGIILVIMTRKSLLGSLIDIQWRLNRISEATLIRWMANSGLRHIEAHRLGGPVWTNWTSMVYTGIKI